MAAPHGGAPARHGDKHLQELSSLSEPPPMSSTTSGQQGHTAFQPQLEGLLTGADSPDTFVADLTDNPDPAQPPRLSGVRSQNFGPGSGITPPLLRRNKAHIASACVNCKKAHLACDASRPCRRCVSLDKQDSCIDVQHKRPGRPRLKDSTPSTGSLYQRPSYLNRHVSDDSWKPQSSSLYVPESGRRQQFLHPYAHYTLPAPAYAMGTNRNTQSYFDIPSPSSTAPTYGVYPARHLQGDSNTKSVTLPYLGEPGAPFRGGRDAQDTTLESFFTKIAHNLADNLDFLSDLSDDEM